MGSPTCQALPSHWGTFEVEVARAISSSKWAESIPESAGTKIFRPLPVSMTRSRFTCTQNDLLSVSRWRTTT